MIISQEVRSDDEDECKDKWAHFGIQLSGIFI